MTIGLDMKDQHETANNLAASKLEVTTRVAEERTAQAMRFNDGKPQLSYLLDFPNALQIVSSLGDEYICLDPIMNVSNFQLNRSGVNAISSVIVDLLFRLQKELNMNHKSGATHVETISELLAETPDAWAEVAQVCSNGAVKYDRCNWHKGLPFIPLIDSFSRHYIKWKSGKKYDNEEIEKDGVKYKFQTHHLAHAIWNLMAMLEYTVIRPEMDNRVKV